MTLEEVQAKLEAGIQNSTVTMEGDGCNCSTLENREIENLES
jgi:acid stress-induced BolA-like protein IbaG/YrbA